jgi:CheY-like chemotaxis protein
MAYGVPETQNELPEFKSLHIGVVEENPINRRLLEVMLSRDGHRVFCFEVVSVLLDTMKRGSVYNLFLVNLTAL